MSGPPPEAEAEPSKTTKTTITLNGKLYTNATSSYWPPGWDIVRWATRTEEDVASLSERELAKLRLGLYGVLGTHLHAELEANIELEKKKRIAQSSKPLLTSNPKPIDPPPWLQHWRKPSGLNRGEWGFVVYRTALYDDELRWEEYKKQLHEVISIPFQEDADRGVLPEDYNEAREKFEMKWIEDPELASASSDDLRARYSALRPSLPPGLSHALFLCASSQSVESMAYADSPRRGIEKSGRWKQAAPFLLGVLACDHGAEEEDDDWTGMEWMRPKPVIRVAAASVVDELFAVVAMRETGMQILTTQVKGSGELDAGQGESTDAKLDNIWWTDCPSPASLRRRHPWISEMETRNLESLRKAAGEQ